MTPSGCPSRTCLVYYIATHMAVRSSSSCDGNHGLVSWGWTREDLTMGWSSCRVYGNSHSGESPSLCPCPHWAGFGIAAPCLALLPRCPLQICWPELPRAETKLGTLLLCSIFQYPFPIISVYLVSEWITCHLQVSFVQCMLIAYVIALSQAFTGPPLKACFHAPCLLT